MHPIEPVDEISYVQGFEPCGWGVGSGIYPGDLREAVLRQVGFNSGIVVVAMSIAGCPFLSFYRVVRQDHRRPRQRSRPRGESQRRGGG